MRHPSNYSANFPPKIGALLMHWWETFSSKSKHWPELLAHCEYLYVCVCVLEGEWDTQTEKWRPSQKRQMLGLSCSFISIPLLIYDKNLSLACANMIIYFHTDSSRDARHYCLCSSLSATFVGWHPYTSKVNWQAFTNTMEKLTAW